MKTGPNEQAIFGESAVCERCGKFGAYQFEGATLCADCYQGAGSCCPEFGADDLWTENEKQDKASDDPFARSDQARAPR